MPVVCGLAQRLAGGRLAGSEQYRRIVGSGSLRGPDRKATTSIAATTTATRTAPAMSHRAPGRRVSIRMRLFYRFFFCIKRTNHLAILSANLFILRFVPPGCHARQAAESSLSTTIFIYGGGWIMQYRRLKSATAALVVIGLVSTALIGSSAASAAPGEPAKRIGEGRTSKAPRRLPAADPVTAAAKSIGKIGRERYAETFAGLKIDHEGGRVLLYATDEKLAARMVQEGLARVSDPAAGKVPVVIERSRYSRQAMDTAGMAVWESAKSWKAQGVEVHSIVLRSDGSGLEIRASDPGRATTLAAQSSGLNRTAVAAAHLTFVTGDKVYSTSRANDSAPYYGGGPIRWDWEFSGYNCTSAFGVRNGAGKEFLATAEHCFTSIGTGVEDGGGDQIGWVRHIDVLHDAELIETDASAGVWLNDTTVDFFTGYDYSWDGEYLCHSGYTSNMVCSFYVSNEAVQWTDDSGKTRVGVEGYACDACAVVDHGDSGGPVWALYSNGALESRGINSAGWGEVTGGYNHMLWTETPSILAALGVSLLT
ncbi:hypothetical protein AB0J72_18910 [Dactylosporangium sp. NPDC049742]|uniref:hypothetical protein n=1 Tax=Dactylosporangium sp. NPDC049742 TaxID=3154737 RepID=UPI003441E35D